jgi:hypothetical protein
MPSTADCKAFLADFVARNPSVVLSIFGPGLDAASAKDLQADATTPAKWKRTYKCKPGGGGNAFTEYTLFDVAVPIQRMGYGPMPKAPASRFVAERGFMLDPDTYDTGVAFVVVEDAKGGLFLANYIGD